MPLPHTAILRAIFLRKNRSRVPTRLTPLRDIKRAVVLIDPAAKDAIGVKTVISGFFAKMNIPVEMITPNRSNLNWLGFLKRKKRDEDLFISLYSSNRFEAKYEAKCSKASMKIGRYRIKKDVFDIIVSDTGGNVSSQTDVFNTIKEILIRID